MKFLIRLLQRIVMVMVAILIIWFIVVQIFQRLDQRLPLFFALMITYFISAYFILPKTIQLTLLILRRGRIPCFTRAKDGLLVDPVNIILMGTKKELKSVFEKIGWSIADPITVKNSLKMIGAFIFNKAYPRAPFSSFVLFGRKQDMGFQKSIDNSPRKRHHIRFWLTNVNEIIDPLDIKYWTKKQKIDDSKNFTWIGAASEDLGFGLTKLTYQITHRIDHNVDKERNYIISALKAAHCIEKIKYYNSGTFKVGKYTSDGRIAVAKLKS